MTGWDERIAQLEAEFPGWHIWRSNAGRWWATRTGSVLRREDLGTGRVMTWTPTTSAACATSSPPRQLSKQIEAYGVTRSLEVVLSAGNSDGHWQSTNASGSASSVPAASRADGRTTPKTTSSVTSAPSSHSGSSGWHSHAERSARARDRRRHVRGEGGRAGDPRAHGHGRVDRVGGGALGQPRRLCPQGGKRGRRGHRHRPAGQVREHREFRPQPDPWHGRQAPAGRRASPAACTAGPRIRRRRCPTGGAPPCGRRRWERAKQPPVRCRP